MVKASLLVLVGSGEGFESLLEHDSKAHPHFVCPRSLARMYIQLLEVWAKCNNGHASGFKVSLSFGGSGYERELVGTSLRAKFHEMKTGAE